MKKLKAKDSLEKEWECELTLKDNALLLQPEGYDRYWPIHLEKDKTFISNVRTQLSYYYGVNKKVKAIKTVADKYIKFVGEGVKELT